MHEMSIAYSVLEKVRTELACRPGVRPEKVGLRIGELSGIDCDSLRFCFEALVKDTELNSLRLDLEMCPRRHRCPQCGREFTVEHYELRCPACGAEETEFISGDQLEIAYLEVEHEPCAAGKESPE